MIPVGTSTIMVDQATFDRALEETVARIRRDQLLTVAGVTMMASKYLPAGAVLMLDRHGRILGRTALATARVDGPVDGTVDGPLETPV